MIDKKSFFRFKNNSLIKISGDDRFNFIQGIISNDINNLKKKPSIYSSILTPQGRFISDFFLSNYKELIKFEFSLDLFLIFIICFFVAYITLKLFIKYINKIGFLPYIVYRIILGFIILALLV